MDQNYTTSSSAARGVTYDAGLRAHMQRVYGRMTAGVLVTAMTAWIVAGTPFLLQLFLGGPQAYLVMFAPLAVLWFGFRPERMASRQLGMAFFAIAVLYGISFSVIALAFTGESIARAFFVASSMFAGLSIFGYTTRKDLTGLGTFAIMGVMGVFFASIGTMIAGAFGVQTTMMQNMIAGVGIIAFAGLTAWETQSTKEMYNAGYGEEMLSRMAWAATLNLYISFIAMFQYLMHFMGQQRQ